MDKKRILIIAAALILIAALVAGFLAFRGGGKETADPTRNNTLLLAQDYLDKGEFQRALDLLDGKLLAVLGRPLAQNTLIGPPGG